jgi:hypothetical protein
MFCKQRDTVASYPTRPCRAMLPSIAREEEHRVLPACRDTTDLGYRWDGGRNADRLVNGDRAMSATSSSVALGLNS